MDDYELQERAAIKEFDGRMSRAQAEHEAVLEFSSISPENPKPASFAGAAARPKGRAARSA